MDNTCPQLHSSAQFSSVLKAAADELRLNVLSVLARDSFGVLELAHLFNSKQSGMSHHLKTLANAGLVSCRREGNSIFYRRSVISPDDPFADIKKTLFQQIDTLALPANIRNNLETVWRSRSEASMRFFAENSEKFQQQQELIAHHSVYHQQTAEILDVSPLPNFDAALEIGPGQGHFIPELSRRFSVVTGLDISEEMLRVTNDLVENTGLNNVQLYNGDTGSLRDFPTQFSCAVANMVLHHTPSPARFIADVAASLAPGGVLLLTDLCLHDQEWVKDACGDLWFGFTPDDLFNWSAEAGLEHGQSAYFALRNGFQIQIQQFIKPLG